MRASAAFSRLLRLPGIWVRTVRFEPARVVVQVALRRRHLVCPECGHRAAGRFDMRPVDSVWRHLDLGVWRLEIHARLRRLWCPIHGARTEAGSSSSPLTRSTIRPTVRQLIRTSRQIVLLSVRVASHATKASKSRVKSEPQRANGTADRLDELFEIGIDEVSWASQHRYLTLVTDHRRRRIVWGAEGHDSATADLFFAALGEQRCQQLEAISLDMGPGYAKSARAHAPQAVIAIDPFHVAKAGSDALDEVRREYWNKLREIGDTDAARRFKGARWALMKNPINLNDNQAATLRRLRAAGGEVWRAYTLKEALRAIFSAGLSIDDVELLLERFISRARRSRLHAFVKLAATIRKHRDGILAAVRLGVTNARAEALNNKVRLIIRRAYGFHSAQAALALIMLSCGPIDLRLPHELHPHP